MSDDRRAELLARLRDDYQKTPELCAEAASDIESLDAEIDRMKRDVWQVSLKVIKAEARNEAYRKAAEICVAATEEWSQPGNASAVVALHQAAKDIEAEITE